MKLTIENLETLSIGQLVYIAHSFKIPSRHVYMGKVEQDYMVFSSSTGNGFSIYIYNPKSNSDFAAENIYTEYEEACEGMRVLCINTINHFNKHQLKNNPIQLSDSDKEFIWKF